MARSCELGSISITETKAKYIDPFQEYSWFYGQIGSYHIDVWKDNKYIYDQNIRNHGHSISVYRIDGSCTMGAAIAPPVEATWGIS